MDLYLDTNIIMDFLLQRDSAAYRVLMEGFACKHRFIICDLVLAELKFQGLGTEGESFITLSAATRKLRVEAITIDDRQHAKRWVREGLTHRNDALHAAIANRKCEGRILTKNIKDFRRVPHSKPIHPDNI